jgi:hypothetical protein
MNLDRSFRILPHKHNTGGFFVALLRKTNKSPELGPSNFCDTVSSDPCLPTFITTYVEFWIYFMLKLPKDSKTEEATSKR